jgi:hypothetical protein
MNRAKLIEHCDRLRSHILSREWAAEEEIGEIWPKQRDPKDKWIECFGHLRFFMGRAEAAQNRIDNADQKLLAALNQDPIPVPLAESLQTKVYPKSFNALLWFHHRDVVVTILQGRLNVLDHIIENNLPEKLQIENIWSLREMIEVEIGRLLTVMAYAATTPGVGIDVEAVESPPEMFQNLSPQELVLIHQAFFEANVNRISLIPYLSITSRNDEDRTKKTNSKRRLSWSVFGSEMANIFKTDVSDILNNRSLTALLAQIRLGADGLRTGF